MTHDSAHDPTKVGETVWVLTWTTEKCFTDILGVFATQQSAKAAGDEERASRFPLHEHRDWFLNIRGTWTMPVFNEGHYLVSEEPIR